MKFPTPITALGDKFLGYMAVTPNKKFMKLFERANVQNILISYHYISKDKIFTRDILQMVRDRGGLFMTDSGIFSFANDKKFDAHTFPWQRYATEYVEWLDQNKEYIFSACNLDADRFVVQEDVLEWNEQYFEPLGKEINIAYVAHKNVRGRGDLDAFKEYADKYNYVAINENLIHMASQIYQYAKKKNVAIHGLAWTRPTILNDFPFFSVDSSTWVNYQKYGATPTWDGTNFVQYDKDNKGIRKTLKSQCDRYGVKFYEFQHEVDEGTTKHNDDEGLTFSLCTWLETFQGIKARSKNKLNITLEDMLEGKITVFEESPIVAALKEAEPVAAAPAGKISKLDEALAIVAPHVGPPVEKKVTYQQNDDGSKVAIYEKREKVDVDIAKLDMGDTLFCDNCHVNDKCPKMQAGASCAFNFAPKGDISSPLATIEFLIRVQTERVNRAMLFENLEGGMTNKTFTQELRTLQELNTTKVNIMIAAKNKGVQITLPNGTVIEADNTPMIGDGGSDNRPIPGGFAGMLIEALKK